MKVSRKKSEIYRTFDAGLRDLDRTIAKVGWVASKKYPNSQMTTAEVAAIAVFGSPANNIPVRDIVNPAIKNTQSKIKSIMLNESKKIIGGKQTAEGALEILGQIVAGEIRKNITTITTPPLKLSTIKARERTYAGRRKTLGARKKQIRQRLSGGLLSKPLVFRKYLLNSCTNTVEKI